jgi:hypothetical protein
VALGRPTRARERSRKAARFGPTAREGRSRLALVGFQATGCTGKFIYLFFCFLFSYEFVFQNHFKIDFKSKSNKTKTTPLNKTNEQHECIIKHPI